MTETSVDEIPISEILTINIDFMGLEAEKVLKIHRNDFVEGFSLKKYKIQYISVWIHFTLKEWIALLESDNVKGIDKISLPSRDSLLIQMKYVRNEDFQNFQKLIDILVERYPDDYVVEGCKLEIKKENIQEKNEKKQIEDEKVTFTKSKITWNLKDFYEKKYMNYINGTGSFLIGTPKRENSNDINNKILDGMIGIFIDKYDDETANIMRKLSNEGVIYDDFLYRLYKGSERQKSYGYSVLLQEKDKLVFVEMKQSEEGEFEIRCSLDELYDKSWDENNSHDFIKFFPKEYDCIAVNEVPYTGEVGKIVIRPFPISRIKEYNERAQKDKLLDKKIISKERFIEEIMGTDSENPSMYFGYLMQWVQNHAIEKETRKDKQIIWTTYYKYVSDIYDVYKRKNWQR